MHLLRKFAVLPFECVQPIDHFLQHRCFGTVRNLGVKGQYQQGEDSSRILARIE